MSYFNKIEVTDNLAGIQLFDAFSRAETANPYTLGDYIHRYDLSPLLWDTSTTGSGTVTHLPNESGVRLRTTTASGDVAVFSSRRYHRYQSGKGGKVVMTLVPGAATADVTKRWGYFDAGNGLFFELAGSTFSVNIRSSTSGSPVTTQITRANFNGDAVDGTGDSGFTLDFTKGNIFEIDFQWLGVGIVQFFVESTEGEKVLLHTFKNPNANTTVYMTTASLPVRYEQQTTGTTTQADLIAICSSVVSSGGEDPPEFEFGFGNAAVVTTSSASETFLIAYQLATTFNSITNRQLVLPKNFTFASNLGPCLFRVYLNGTVTGGSWVAVNANSCVEYNITASFSAGIPLIYYPVVVSTTPSGGNRAINTQTGVRKLALSLNAAASASDNIIITVMRLTSTNVDAMATMEWGELR